MGLSRQAGRQAKKKNLFVTCLKRRLLVSTRLFTHRPAQNTHIDFHSSSINVSVLLIEAVGSQTGTEAPQTVTVRPIRGFSLALKKNNNIQTNKKNSFVPKRQNNLAESASRGRFFSRRFKVFFCFFSPRQLLFAAERRRGSLLEREACYEAV